MRILVVTTELPYPPTWGGAIRNFHFLEHLARHHDVHLLSFDLPRDMADARGLRELGIDVEVVHWRTPASKRAVQLLSAAAPRSFWGHKFHQRDMQVAIRRVMARHDLDAVLVESSMLWRYDFGARTPIVLDEHNVEFEILERTYRSERSPVRKVYSYLEYRKFRREELAAWRQATRCVFTSERERDIMLAHRLSTPATAIPNGVDLQYLRPGDDGERDPSSVVFTGRIGYRPNTDALLYFVREMLPRIHRRRPDVVLTVAGADVPPEVQRLAGPRIVVTGAVPDMRPYWRRAAVVLVPLRFGGGTRFKILEAMGMGRPIVSTTLGCEGIDAVPGDHLLVADSPEEFADAVLRVLDDPALGRRLGERGRSLVEARYSWTRLSEDLEAVLASSARPAASARGIEAELV